MTTPPQPAPLFNKIEESQAQSLKERFAGGQNKATPTNTAALQKQLDKQVRLVVVCWRIGNNCVTSSCVGGRK